MNHHEAIRKIVDETLAEPQPGKLTRLINRLIVFRDTCKTGRNPDSSIVPAMEIHNFRRILENACKVIDRNKGPEWSSFDVKTRHELTQLLETLYSEGGSRRYIPAEMNVGDMVRAKWKINPSFFMPALCRKGDILEIVGSRSSLGNYRVARPGMTSFLINENAIERI